MLAAGAALLPPLLTAAWFAYRGSLRDLLDVHLLYTLQTYSANRSHQIRPLAAGVLKFFLKGPVAWAIPIMAAGIWSVARQSRTSAVLSGAWIAYAVACVAAQGKFYVYHWVMVMPPILVLAAAGFRALFSTVSEHRSLAWRTAALLALLGAPVSFAELLPVPASAATMWAKLMAGRISRREYTSQFGGYARRVDAAAEYIRGRTAASDPVAVYGNESALTFLTGRPNPTRFVFALPLTEGGPASPRAHYRREFVLALQQTPPVYFVVGQPWGATTKTNALHGFPELEDFLNHGYSLESHIGVLDLYRRQKKHT